MEKMIKLFLEVDFFLSDFKAKTVYGGEYRQNGNFFVQILAYCMTSHLLCGLGSATRSLETIS